MPTSMDVNSGISTSELPGHLFVSLLGIGSIVLFCYLSFAPQFDRNSRQKVELHTPVKYPYALPLVGHALQWYWNPSLFISSLIAYSRKNPVRLRLLSRDVYFVSGPENIRAVFKHQHMHGKALRDLALENMFKTPKATLETILADDSGGLESPHPESQTPPHLRVGYLTYSSVTKSMSGSNLQVYAQKFADNLAAQLSNKIEKDIGWVSIGDLFSWMHDEYFVAGATSLYGEHLMKVSPSLPRNFLGFSHGLPSLAKRLPRWAYPEPYRCRDACLEDLKKWHRYIQSHLNSNDVGQENWSPHYGAQFNKRRHQGWSKIHKIDADGAASEDLGLLWASNANTIAASYWIFVEVIRDPLLLLKVREVVSECRVNPGDRELAFDSSRLCNHPLLVSIYAETLRLRVTSYLMHTPAHKDFQLGPWTLPKDNPILFYGYAEQTNEAVWGTDTGHPANVFWAERFLKYSSNGQPEFSFRGRATSWMPYGGGHRICPGRHMAKQEMILGLAIMLTLFDVELLDRKGKIPQPDKNGFGFGAILPKDSTPVRIRRRIV